MATTVGTESTYQDLLKNMLLLEHDAIAAYDQTISRLETPAFKEQVAAFKGDHERHVSELTRLAASAGVEPPTSGDFKQMLTTGKIAMASLMGDSKILGAMRTNEEDTVTAYERASKHAEVPAEAVSVFEQGLSDERRHREWMQTTAKGG